MSAARSVGVLDGLDGSIRRVPAAGVRTYVDLPVLEALLQVLVYGFVRDLAKQSKIRHADLLLLGALEDSLLREAGLRGPASGGILLAPGALAHSLYRLGQCLRPLCSWFGKRYRRHGCCPMLWHAQTPGGLSLCRVVVTAQVMEQESGSRAGSRAVGRLDALDDRWGCLQRQGQRGMVRCSAVAADVGM